jgi:SAM-dependent methyltransferase
MNFHLQLFIEHLNHVLFWACAILLAWNVYMLVFNKGVPNIRTAPGVRKKIIEVLQQDAKAKGKHSYTIIDLGSGNGLLTREIAKALPEAKVIGLEVSASALKWSEKLRDRAGLKNLEYKKADFFEYDMSKADAVVMFLNIYMMDKIGKKLHQNTRKGTLITSNRFPLGDGWKPAEVLEAKTLYPFQKKLHVYYS